MKIERLLRNLLIRQNNKLGKLILTICLLSFGMALPFLVVQYVSAHSRGDVWTFHSWADCLERSSQKIYLDCSSDDPFVNYPVSGLILSAGAIHVIRYVFGGSAGNTVTSIFRSYLAIFDSLNFLLFIWLASLMRFRSPIFVGLIILIVPSTIIGGSLWGQIDGVSLFFCLLATISFFKSWLSNDSEDRSHTGGWKHVIWLLLGMLALSIYILTKQLSIFSLPFFLLLILITIWRFWKGFGYKGLFLVFLSLSLFVLSFRYMDSLFELPQHFNDSSYWYVWTGGGSHHGNKIAGNGFNIWLFLGRGMSSSSHIPFSDVEIRNWKLSLSPYNCGIILYSLLMFFLLFTSLRSCLRILKREVYVGQKVQDSSVEGYLIALLCFFFGISYLGFNVLLSGTHQRYLYLGYPFLLIAVTWFCTNRFVFSRRSTILCFFAASAYGCFVLSTMVKSPSTKAKWNLLPGVLFLLKSHEFLAAIHLFLLLFLLGMWVQVCQGDGRNRLADSTKHAAQKTIATGEVR